MTLTFARRPPGPGRRPPAQTPGERRPHRPYTTEEDALIIERYSQEPLRAIAERLGRRVATVQAHVERLIRDGRLNRRDRFYNPPWTQAEVDFLLDYRGDMTDAELARQLGRSETAVVVKGKRRGAMRKSNWLTARGVAQILGQDDHRIVALAREGRLRMRQLGVVGAGAAFAWRCEIAELERFLREETDCYDRKRISEEPWRGMARRAWERDPWLTVREAAPLLGLHPRTAARLLAEGRLVGRKRRDHGGTGTWILRRSWVEQCCRAVRVGVGRQRNGGTEGEAAG